MTIILGFIFKNNKITHNFKMNAQSKPKAYSADDIALAYTEMLNNPHNAFLAGETIKPRMSIPTINPSVQKRVQLKNQPRRHPRSRPYPLNKTIQQKRHQKSQILTKRCPMEKKP